MFYNLIKGLCLFLYNSYEIISFEEVLNKMPYFLNMIKIPSTKLYKERTIKN